MPQPRFFYEHRGSTSDPVRLITSGSSLAFHNGRSLKQTCQADSYRWINAGEKAAKGQAQSLREVQCWKAIGKAIGKEIPRNSTLFSNQEITVSSMSSIVSCSSIVSMSSIVSCLLLTFPSLSHGVWIWKKSLFVHGGRSIHALDPSSKKKGLGTGC